MADNWWSVPLIYVLLLGSNSQRLLFFAHKTWSYFKYLAFFTILHVLLDWNGFYLLLYLVKRCGALQESSVQDEIWLAWFECDRQKSRPIAFQVFLNGTFASDGLVWVCQESSGIFTHKQLQCLQRMVQKKRKYRQFSGWKKCLVWCQSSEEN